MKSRIPGLRLFFVLTVSLVTLVLTLTLTCVTSQQYRQEAIEQLIHHVETVTRNFVLAVTDYIITENYSSLQDFVLSNANRQHLREITVFSPDGIILADSNPHNLGRRNSDVISGHVDDRVRFDFNAGTMTAFAPVSLEDTVVGWCRLVVNTEHLNNSLSRLRWQTVFWGGVIWLIAVAIVVVIASFITRPLAGILDTARQITSGCFSGRNEVGGPQEIRQLIQAFNTMGDEIAKREQQLRESENRFRSLVEDIDDWVWETNDRGEYTYASPAVKRLLGYAPGEVLGKFPWDFMGRSEAERVKELYNQYVEQRLEFRHLVISLVHKDGRGIIVETAGRPVFNAWGQFVGYRGVDRDITERQKAAQERKQLEQLLHQSQKMEAIGTLAGGIAHDFNNILAAILGYAEVACMDLDPDSRAKEDIRQVITAGERAVALVRQILTFSRSTHHEKQLLRLDLVVKETLKLLRSSLPVSVEIKVDVQPDAGMILADPTRIHQVVMNLCTNAFQAMKQEKGVLAVSLHREMIRVAGLERRYDVPDGEYITLTVSDTGHGMTDEVLERIFEPYFSTREIGDGSGLGLAIVHGIVKECGGFIQVDSSPDKGTIFRIHFPVADKTVEENDQYEEEEMPTGDERIIFVDDEPALVELSSTVLRRAGYTVFGFTNSGKALQAFLDAPYDVDLVISDQTMPGMNGSEMAVAMLEVRPELPVILCTGYSGVVSKQDALDFGFRRYLSKPISRARLARCVREVLDEVKNTTSSLKEE